MSRWLQQASFIARFDDRVLLGTLVRLAASIILFTDIITSWTMLQYAAAEDAPLQGTHSSAAVSVGPAAALKDLGGGLTISDSTVEFPPLNREDLDYFFDSIRGGGAFNPVPLHQSDQVPNRISGIWAGTRSSVDSRIGLIKLRFRPSDEARLAAAESGKGAATLAESFDVELELGPLEFIVRHPLASDVLTRAGLVVRLVDGKLTQVFTEFIKGYRDAGMYLSWPSVNDRLAQKAWSLLICPRTPKLVQRRRTEEPRLELHPSPYELREVYFTVTANAKASIPPAARPERISLRLLPSANLPRAGQNHDEVRSLSPNLEVPYRPLSPFEFIKLQPSTGHIQEGILVETETENPAGYIRRQYYSHLLYVHRVQEPSPVGVIIGDRRAARDEGACYVISERRSLWNNYDRLVADEAQPNMPQPVNAVSG